MIFTFPPNLKAYIDSLKVYVRSELVGTVIDFDIGADEGKYKTLTGNTIFTIINPTQGKQIIIKLDGIFTVTLPGTVTVVNGDYTPNVGINYLFLFCEDESTPHYLASWTVLA